MTDEQLRYICEAIERASIVIAAALMQTPGMWAEKPLIKAQEFSAKAQVRP